MRNLLKFTRQLIGKVVRKFLFKPVDSPHVGTDVVYTLDADDADRINRQMPSAQVSKGDDFRAVVVSVGEEFTCLRVAVGKGRVWLKQRAQSGNALGCYRKPLRTPKVEPEPMPEDEETL